MKKVFINLDRERELELDYNAICDIEAVLGMSVVLVFSDLKNVGFNTTRAMLWGALKTKNPQIDISRTGTLLGEYLKSGKDQTYILNKLTEAINASGLFAKNTNESDEEDSEGEAGTEIE